MFRLFGRREPALTRIEAFIQREFDEEIESCEKDWTGFHRHFLHVLPDFDERYTLEQRVQAFVQGPVLSELDRCFPRIAEMAGRGPADTDVEAIKRDMLLAIVKEGLVRAGLARAEMRAIFG